MKPENEPVGICAVGGSCGITGITGKVGLVAGAGSGCGAAAAKEDGAWRALCPETTSSTSSGGCGVESPDLTSIIALGSAHSPSARSGLAWVSPLSPLEDPASL